MTTTTATLQMAHTWHNGGLFMGMHWIWWTFWILVLAVLGGAFVRLFRDQADARREIEAEVDAEAILRARFARGDIDEDELARGLRVLRRHPRGV